MVSMPELTEIQLSALSEAGNIGTGHAAIALSQLLGRKIMLSVTKIRIAALKEFKSEMDGEDTLITGACLKVLGDVQGSILLVLVRKSAFSLVDVLLNQKIGSTKVLNEMEQSALKETSSILSASYLNALSDLMGLTLIPSVPRMLIDKAGVVFDTVFEGTLRKSDLALGIETEFMEAHIRIKGYFIFMPSVQGLAILIKALGA